MKVSLIYKLVSITTAVTVVICSCLSQNFPSETVTTSVVLEHTLENDLAHDIYVDVKRTSPMLTISKESLILADSLIHINRFYKPSWVKEYISVETITTQNGVLAKTTTPNDLLSKAQKDQMSSADFGTDILIVVHYIPENNLEHNVAQIFDFSFKIDPEHKAEFTGGADQLKAYLNENITEKLTDGSLKQYELSAVTFVITPEGNITNARVFSPSNNETVEALLLEAVLNMPNWTPATYADGTTTAQEFALTVGDEESCIMNLLNIVENQD